MSTFKTLIDFIMRTLDTDFAGVERLLRWQEHEGMCRRGSFMRSSTFMKSYNGGKVPIQIRGVTVEIATLAIDLSPQLAHVEDKVGYLLDNITKASPIACVRKTCGLSITTLAWIMGTDRRATEHLCKDDWWEWGSVEHDPHFHNRLFAPLAALLAEWVESPSAAPVLGLTTPRQGADSAIY